MKPLHLVIAMLLICAPCLRAEAALKDGDILAMTGDSITQQKSYSAIIEEYLLLCQSTTDLKQVVEFGWSGEEAAGLLARVDTELYPFQPTVVATSYGMNDGHYQPLTAQTGDAYRAALNGLIDSFRKHGVREVILGSPGCVDSYYFRKFQNDAPFDPAVPAMYNRTLGGLADIAKDVAMKQHARFADVHAVTMATMAKFKAAHGEKAPFINNNDGVHPALEGQLCMVYAYLKGLGCDGSIGTITIDLANDQATATPGQKIISMKQGTVEIETTRFPFCFQPEAANILALLPFNQELNRYLLVVKGLGGAGAKVTWGQASRRFTAQELAKGINLAAEFPVNPICELFGRFWGVVQRQQEQDRELEQAYLHSITSASAEVAAPLARAIKTGLEWDRDLFRLCKANIGTIKHTLKVEAAP